MGRRAGAVRAYREVDARLRRAGATQNLVPRLEGDALVALVHAQVGTKAAPNLQATAKAAQGHTSVLKADHGGQRRTAHHPDPPLVIPMRDLLASEQTPA